jgi:outer membrane biosynthesis protein TonB
MRLLLRAAIVVLMASASVACVNLRARTQPEGPSLDVPAPPPLVGTPLEIEPPPQEVQPTPVQADAIPAGGASRARPPKPVPAPKIEKPDKTEPPPAPPAKPAEAAPPAVALQTTVKVDELGQKIRDSIDRAIRDLNKVERRTLGAERRAQYDEARRFAEQAEAALKVRNLPFAEQLADKAATLADLLVKR